MGNGEGHNRAPQAGHAWYILPGSTPYSTSIHLMDGVAEAIERHTVIHLLDGAAEATVVPRKVAASSTLSTSVDFNQGYGRSN